VTSYSLLLNDNLLDQMLCSQSVARDMDCVEFANALSLH
jgi:hypothetical protein